MPASFDSALESFRKSSKINPETTWFIHDYPKDIANAIAECGHCLLTNQIVSLEDFGKLVIAKAGKTVLDADTQYLKFADIASRSPLKTGDYPLPPQLISEIRSIYNFTSYYNVTVPKSPKKFKIIGDIIDEYRRWCHEEGILDSLTAIKEAARIIRNHEFPAEMLVYCSSGLRNPLLQELYDSLKTYPHVEFELEETEPKAEITCLQYHTAKSEITATIDKIAELLESGVTPENILVLSPSLDAAEAAFREYAPDFYVTVDDIPRPFLYSCSGSGPALKDIPVVSAVLSALSAVTGDYSIRDLENVLSSPYFPYRKAPALTAGKLHLIAELAGKTSGKAFLKKLEYRVTDKNGFSRYKTEIGQIKNLLKWLEPLEKPGSTYEEISNSLIKWLAESGWMSAEADDLNMDARGSLLSILTKLKKSLVCHDPITIAGFTALLQRLTTERKVRMYVENGVKVANLRDSSVEDADYVFIVGMTAESVPKVPPTLPPLTESETDTLLPSLKEDMYRREDEHMKKALRRARKSLVISYPERQKKKAFSPSGFLTREGELQKVNAPVLTHSISRNQVKAGKDLRNGGTVTGGKVGLTDGFDVYQRARGVQIQASTRYDFTASAEYRDAEYHQITSPTAIETYLSCPLQWFFSHHMELYTPFDESNEGTKIGTAIHDTMEAFIKAFPETVTEENRDEARELLFRLAEENIDGMKIQSPTWEAEKRKYLGMNGNLSPLDEMLNLEIKLGEKGWKTTENMVEHPFNRVLECGDKKISVNGRIDRILTNNKNEYIVLDYKTGSSFTYKPETKVQIPLYAEAYREEANMVPADGIYLKINPKGNPVLDPISVTSGENGAVIPINDVITTALGRCVTAIDGMQQGKCSPPEECPDRYCNFKSLCWMYKGKQEDKE